MGVLSIILAWLIVVGAAVGRGGIVGSKHDLRGPASSRGDVCQACHHPLTFRGQTPRWEATYGPQSAFDLYDDRQSSVQSVDLKCLSCHDGAIATVISSGNAQASGANSLRMSPSDVGGGAVHGSHPIGVTYPLGGDGYHARSSVLATRTVRLPGARVSCVSCHDPHGTAGHEYLLVRSNRRSQLCTSCHDL